MISGALKVKQFLRRSTCMTCGTRCVVYLSTEPKISLVNWVTFGKSGRDCNNDLWNISDIINLWKGYVITVTQLVRAFVKFTKGCLRIYHLELLVWLLTCEQQPPISEIIVRNTKLWILKKTVMLYMKPVNVEMTHIIIDHEDAFIF